VQRNPPLGVVVGDAGLRRRPFAAAFLGISRQRIESPTSCLPEVPSAV
jgi:hypothetical protein